MTLHGKLGPKHKNSTRNSKCVVNIRLFLYFVSLKDDGSKYIIYFFTCLEVEHVTQIVPRTEEKKKEVCWFKVYMLQISDITWRKMVISIN